MKNVSDGNRSIHPYIIFIRDGGKAIFFALLRRQSLELIKADELFHQFRVQIYAWNSLCPFIHPDPDQSRWRRKLRKLLRTTPWIINRLEIGRRLLSLARHNIWLPAGPQMKRWQTSYEWNESGWRQKVETRFAISVSDERRKERGTKERNEKKVEFLAAIFHMARAHSQHEFTTDDRRWRSHAHRTKRSTAAEENRHIFCVWKRHS